jgi:hypothetical protein
VAERRGEPGEIVERALEVLRVLPPAESPAVARIVATAARARSIDASPNDDDLLPLAVPPRPSWLGLGSIAAAAVIGVLFLGVAIWKSMDVRTIDRGGSTAPMSGARTALTPVAASAAEAALVPTQFVFDGRARRVVLVGDFNNWDDRATPLQREPGSRLWSVTLPIPRGRHIYAFLVDSTWTVDKRAPVARDPDFGVTGSVIIVGRP